MTIFGLLLLLACHGVEGDSILGRDLAAADAQFSGIPADARLGYAPLPGAQRTLGAMELQRIATRFGLAGEFHDLCFEYPTRQLETGEIAAALRASLGVAEADIKVVEFSLYAVPAGEMVFPLSGLGRPSAMYASDPVIWHGYIKFAGARKFAVWAKVLVRVKETRVIAADDLMAGQPVSASQLRLETASVFPAAQPVAGAVEQIVGKTLRQSVKKGSPVALDAVVGARRAGEREVNRGESVEVDVDAGLAHLKFEGRAESGGALGETVTVRNAKSGRTFAARVVGKGRVEVVTGASE